MQPSFITPRTRQPLAVVLRFLLALMTSAMVTLGAEEDPSVAGQNHWAFKPLPISAVPSVRNRGWSRNALDHFVLAEMEKRELTPADPATREQLLRRLTLDLVGLPPTREQRDAYLEDKDPDATLRLIDLLLASPHYGERWGRHWLDLARFGESDGFELDAIRTNSWRYRDYVINAFNSDKPYDRFIQEQVAGDELWPGDRDAIIATGFNLLGPDMVDSADQVQRRLNTLNDMTDTTAVVFLGLTLGCARCHDHKFEPLSQKDYYAFQAFFTPAKFHRDFVIATSAERKKIQEQKDAKVEEARAAEAEVATDNPATKKKSKQPPDPTAGLPKALALSSGPSTNTHLLIRGDYNRPGEIISPDVPTILKPGLKVTERRHPRRALANWLASPKNPLTARVMVNRIWQYHFGRGLVRSASDFGVTGEQPSHPELLDWLANEFMASGWSVKHLHRIILASATYQQSSRAASATLALDPDNRFYSRYQRVRLQGEILRDSLLAVSGELDPQLGGPSVFPRIPAEVAKGSVGWPKATAPSDGKRRSLYIFSRRNLRYPFLEVFDAPDSNLSCALRNTSTTAPQALALLNATEVLEAARVTSERVRHENAHPSAQVEAVFRDCLGRSPTAEERKQCLDFLERSSLLELSRAIFNLNAFAYVD